MKKIILFLSIGLASGLLFVNLYTSLIDAKSWGGDIPNSISAAREYFKVVNPGNFFRIFSPVNQILGVAALILFWKASPSTRLFFGVAAIMYILADVFTFAYFYPRNAIMFEAGSLNDVALLKRTLTEWTTMNWLRTFILVVGVFCSFISLHRIYGPVSTVRG